VTSENGIFKIFKILKIFTNYYRREDASEMKGDLLLAYGESTPSLQAIYNLVKQFR